MHRTAAYRLAAVLAPHDDRVLAVDHPRVGPVKLVLLGLVGSEVLQRAKPWTGIEADDGEALFGKAGDQRPAPRAGADDNEVYFFGFPVFAHRYPAAHPHHVRRASAGAARRGKGISRHGRSSWLKL